MATIKSIGKKLKEARKALGLSQEELSGLADIDRSYVSNIENGQANISLGMLFTLCSVLKIKPKSLFE